MSYNSNIPQSTSKRQISQKQILANFQAIAAAFSENHSALGLGTQGQHIALVLRPQGSDPTTSATETAIYQKLVTGIPNWFYRPSSNQTPIQMSYPSIVTGIQSMNPTVYFPQQYSFMAGPFVVYMGKIVNPTNGQTVTLTPVTTLRYVGLSVTNYKFTGTVPSSFFPTAIPTSVAANSFNISFTTAKPSNVSLDIYYLAIGN